MEPSVPTSKRRVWLVVALVLGAPVVLALLWFLWQIIAFYAQIQGGSLDDLKDRRLQASIARTIANAEVKPEDLARLVPSVGNYPEIGSRNARVTIVEFVDYQCPFCKQSAPVVRRVMEAFKDRVRLIIRDYPITELHPTASQSALAANCALEQGQDVYWRYHDLLFGDVTNQTNQVLREKADLAGVRTADFDTCVSQERYVKKINADIEAGLRTGVQGTPTFFVNGIRFQGAMDEKTLTRVLNAALEQLPN